MKIPYSVLLRTVTQWSVGSGRQSHSRNVQPRSC